MRKILFTFIALLFVPLAGAHAQVNTSSLLTLINAERHAAGLNDVTLNPKLSQAAQMKANDMVTQNYFEHVGPDGKDPWSWYAAVDYDWSWAGEILALNTNTESNEEIVKSWMNSPGHRAIIMDGRYTEVGIGVAAGTYQGQRAVYAVGEFGVPKVAASQALPAQVHASVPAPQPVQVKAIVQTTLPVVKTVVAKIVPKVIPKAEAKTVEQITSGSTIVSTSTPVIQIVKLSWLIRIKTFLASLFTFSSRRVG
jgi:hypothetical protein